MQINKINMDSDFDYEHTQIAGTSTYNASKVVLNIDCGLFDAKLAKFIENNDNKTIKRHVFYKTWIPVEDLDELVEELSKNYIVHTLQKVIYFFNDVLICKFNISPSGLDEGILYYTNDSELSTALDIIKNLTNTAHKLDIRWITDANGNYYNIVELMNDVVEDSLYPYIKEGVHNYIDDFLKSKSSILILIGQPGTGKSNFVREVIATMNKKAFITYNEAVFRDDDAFAEFVSSDTAGIFVIEDADLLLKSRDTGNELMAKFLNIGDGVIKLNGKKLIFTTNLPSTKDIDPAIMRAGRCYDVLNFRPLTLDEANAVCKDYILTLFTEDREYKLTEIFNRKQTKAQKGMGFY